MTLHYCYIDANYVIRFCRPIVFRTV